MARGWLRRQESRPLAAHELHRGAHEGDHEQTRQGQSQDEPSAHSVT